ncbi:thiosulfate oxidation carrier protein SoxY [Niveibacterium sp.]|uniref:thiosulfate oxidation carrier protein SoxY n=1 Tax=Niveibacterium sp. TaxID=2017444 RepID=UPI0035B25883
MIRNALSFALVVMLWCPAAFGVSPSAPAKPTTKAEAKVLSPSESAAKSPVELDPTLPTLPKGLFDVIGVQAAMSLLGASSAQESPRILLEVPDIYDRTAAIPVRVKAALPSVEAVVLLHERESKPVLVGFAMRPVQDAEFAFAISAKKTGVLRALVKSEGKWLFAQKTLRLATESWK